MHSTSTLPPQSRFHVVIIGAGLGGLCLAQGLRKNGISVAVYEKDASPFSRSQGYCIRIDQTGRHALQACLPPHRYLAFERTCAGSASGPNAGVAGVNTVNGRLETLAGKWVDSWRDGRHGETPDLRADRQTMRRVLLDGLQDCVHFGKQFLHYEERDDGKVLAHFVNGASVTADVLVAADGIHSAVAAQRFPHLKTIDSGNVCIYGKTPLTDQSRMAVASSLQTGTTVIFEKELTGVVDAMRFDPSACGKDHTPPDDYLYWALVGDQQRFGLDKESDLRLSPENLGKLIDNVTAHWKPSLKVLYQLSDPGMRTVVAIRTAPIPTAWEASRVTALGDAIHAMSPAGGLGANTALNDAAMLSQVLLEAGNEARDDAASGKSTCDTVTPAIDLYETLMCARGFAAVHASDHGGRQLLGKDETSIVC